MISADMKLYNYYTYGTYDEYGQPIVSADVKGQVKMAIYTTSQSIQDNVLYEDCAYIGMTTDGGINSTYIIENENKERLKVLYINPRGRYKQVFMAGM